MMMITFQQFYINKCFLAVDNQLSNAFSSGNLDSETIQKYNLVCLNEHQCISFSLILMPFNIIMCRRTHVNKRSQPTCLHSMLYSLE